jgi:hypothetical protein
MLLTGTVILAGGLSRRREDIAAILDRQDKPTAQNAAARRPCRHRAAEQNEHFTTRSKRP